jgi:hypothetical protein
MMPPFSSVGGGSGSIACPIDDEAAAALGIATQLVLLGAGFDMRALRLPQAAHACAFELDYPPTLAKRALLKNAQRTVPERIRYVGIDFKGSRSRRPSCMPDSTSHGLPVGSGKASQTT